MRVVLDTNILISGIFFGGVPGKIIDAWVDQAFSLIVTPDILSEYAITINRLSGKHENVLAYEWLNVLFDLSHVVADLAHPVSYCRDKHDDKFIHCAINAKADYLVSGDKDLLSAPNSFNFKILTPRKFLSYI